MSTGTITEILQGVGAGDEAIKAMGPVLTIIMAWVGGVAVAQTLKFPLAVWVKDSWHGAVTRQIAIFAAWLFAHFLSDHLSNMLEVIVAFCTPWVYLIVIRLVINYFPWVEGSYLGSVGAKEASKDSKS